MEKIPTPEVPKLTMKDAYVLLGASTPLELNTLYDREDQKLMQGQAWDYNNPDLTINKVKRILEKVDATTLSGEEKEWRNNILWFWNHHAISCAVWRYKDQQAAQQFSEQALKFQSDDHPNQITKLLFFLTHGELDLAEEWLLQINDKVEKETAEYLIDTYKRGGFYIEQLPS